MVVSVLGAPSASAQDTTTTTTPGAPSQPAPSPTGEEISGELLNRDDNNKPVEGVEITVEDAAGNVIGTATSDDEGAYSIPLPGPGQYTATLDPDTLPDGVTLTDPTRSTLTFTVRPGQQRPLLFPFGKDTREVSGTTDRIIPLLIEGFRLGLIIAMTAIGLSLIYGTTKFTNFAHGEMVTFGALVAFFLNQTLGLQLFFAAIIAFIVSCAAGAGLEMGLWRPLRRRGSSLFGLMIVSFGLSSFLLALYQYLFGARTRPYSNYAIQADGVSIGNVVVPPKTFFVIIFSILVLSGVGLFISKARFGKAMRAVADNGPLASSSGIDTDRVVLLVWIFGSGLAGLGGILYSINDQVSFQEGQTLLLLMFAGITLGGLGTAYGAAIGCIVLGIFIQVSTLWLPTSLKNVGALFVLVVVLLFRPEGIFGQRERVG